MPQSLAFNSNFQFQFFQISGAFYTTCVAIELANTIKNTLTFNRDVDDGLELSWVKRRHLMYHTVVISYGVAVITWMIVAKTAGALPGEITGQFNYLMIVTLTSFNFKGVNLASAGLFMLNTLGILH